MELTSPMAGNAAKIKTAIEYFILLIKCVWTVSDVGGELLSRGDVRRG